MIEAELAPDSSGTRLHVNTREAESYALRALGLEVVGPSPGAKPE